VKKSFEPIVKYYNRFYDQSEFKFGPTQNQIMMDVMRVIKKKKYENDDERACEILAEFLRIAYSEYDGPL
jgi:hypothetical protein